MRESDSGMRDIGAKRPPQPEGIPGPSQAASGAPSLVQEGSKLGNSEYTLSMTPCLVETIHRDFDTIDREALNDHLREGEDYILSHTGFRQPLCPRRLPKNYPRSNLWPTRGRGR